MDPNETPESSPEVLTIDAGRVAQCLDDLHADFDRQSGNLSWDDVHQLVFGRSLNSLEAVDVWRQALGRFRLPPLFAEPSARKSSGTSLLTAIEERSLARWVVAARLATHPAIPAEGAEIASSVRAVGIRAREILILANTGLVGSIVGRFLTRTRLERADLTQEGVLGLMRAIEKFAPEMGYRLTTYATWWIEQHLLRAIDTKDRIIRLPNQVQLALRQLKRKRLLLRNQLGRLPTSAELASELGLDEGETNLLLRVDQDAMALDEVAYEPDTGCSGRRATRHSAPDRELHQSELKELIERRLQSLGTRCRFVITQRFELDGRSKRTLKSLGEKLKLTRERVRQIEVKGLDRLSHGPGGDALKDYIED